MLYFTVNTWQQTDENKMFGSKISVVSEKKVMYCVYYTWVMDKMFCSVLFCAVTATGS